MAEFGNTTGGGGSFGEEVDITQTDEGKYACMLWYRIEVILNYPSHFKVNSTPFDISVETLVWIRKFCGVDMGNEDWLPLSEAATRAEIKGGLRKVIINEDLTLNKWRVNPALCNNPLRDWANEYSIWAGAFRRNITVFDPKIRGGRWPKSEKRGLIKLGCCKCPGEAVEELYNFGGPHVTKGHTEVWSAATTEAYLDGVKMGFVRGAAKGAKCCVEGNIVPSGEDE